jgi:hypothetical protein
VPHCFTKMTYSFNDCLGVGEDAFHRVDSLLYWGWIPNDGVWEKESTRLLLSATGC